MKLLISILLFFLLACGRQTANNPSTQVDASIGKGLTSIDKARHYATADTIIIASKYFDTIRYSKEEFNQIVDNFPSLHASDPVDPDISYAQSGYFRDITDKYGNNKNISFGSEQGRDLYYILYSYFLSNQQRDAQSDFVRENLISIYQNINDIFGSLNNGGTYFTHQFHRINGYAEYGVYQYRQIGRAEGKSTDIQKLKKLYIASLKELIRVEIESDSDLHQRKDKMKKAKALMKNVDGLDRLITSNFYLKMARQFQYSHY
jgi:hypothetical protein